MSLAQGTQEANSLGTQDHMTLPVLLSILFLNFVGYGIVTPLLPFYRDLFSAQPWQVTMVFAAFAIGQLVGELFWGQLSDRIGRKPVLVLTMMCAASGYALLAFAPNIWIAIAARGASGFFSGNLSTVQSYIVDSSPRERLAGRLGYISASVGVALGVGPAIGGFLSQPSLGQVGFALPLAIAGAFSIATGTLAWLTLRESRVAQRAPTEPTAQKLSWRAALGNPVLCLLLCVSFLAFLSFAVVNSTLGLWGMDRFAWQPRDVGVILTTTGIAMALAQIFVTKRMARWIGEPATITSGMLIGGVALLILPIIPHALWAAPCLIGHTIGMAFYQPSTLSLVSDCVGPDRKGSILGMNAAFGALGRVIGPLGAGVLITKLSSGAPFFFASIAMLIGAVLTVTASTKLRRRERGEQRKPL